MAAMHGEINYKPLEICFNKGLVGVVSLVKG